MLTLSTTAGTILNSMMLRSVAPVGFLPPAALVSAMPFKMAPVVSAALPGACRSRHPASSAPHRLTVNRANLILDYGPEPAHTATEPTLARHPADRRLARLAGD